jgi:hypothetical protein
MFYVNNAPQIYGVSLWNSSDTDDQAYRAIQVNICVS